MISIREKVIEESMTWLNTPYHHQARIKGAGVDCAMILAEVYHACGLIPYIETPEYPPDWHMHRSAERYLNFISKYAHKVEKPLMGDIAMFKFGRCASHAGIIIDWPNIIHSYYKSGVTLGNGEDAELRGRVVGFYSLFEE